MKYFGAVAIALTLAFCYAAPQQSGSSSGTQAGTSGQAGGSGQAGFGFGVSAGASGQLDGSGSSGKSASGLVKRDLTGHAHTSQHTRTSQTHTASCNHGPPPPGNFTN
ncbi:uncharacterized protein LOC109540014 isoform X1 [Dendroctonus ponderosae]|uniref:uncharacterized protein LOC109540014 isoform X1 n=1 Tax=Dendroctonus ponderosae TaxID=77166 RepID=UPI0020362822|nr:uncharacterized protein LOC109540014 isoform X1 [Dendroctonus ponderosae]KAH1018116.1 hypothetical protein HUJ05_005932 [Dendroctonus ponderosae]